MLADARKTRLRVIDGPTTPRPRIAMSFVHPLGRLDIGAQAVLGVEANLDPHCHAMRAGLERVDIAIGLDADTHAKLYVMTRKILASDAADLPLEIHVGGRCIVALGLREALGKMPTFFVSVFGLAEANDYAASLTSRCARPRLRIVGGDIGARPDG